MKIELLYEDNSLLVAVKPPKIPSQPDKTGDMDMLSYFEAYYEQKRQNSYVGVIHRLDRPVGGVMVFARSKKMAAELSEQVRTRKLHETYFVVVCGKPAKAKGQFCHYMIKNTKQNLSKIVSKNTANAKQALLEYEVLETIEEEQFATLSLVEINLITGRHHQIRTQFAYEGVGIWGDNKYNPLFAKGKGWTQIALWAGKLSFYHADKQQQMQFCKIPLEYPFSLFQYFSNNKMSENSDK